MGVLEIAGLHRWAVGSLFAFGCNVEPVEPVEFIEIAPSEARDAGTVQPDLLILLASGLRSDPGDTLGAESALLAPLGARVTWSFDDAYTASPSQLVSLGSLLTGRYPSAIPMCGLIRTGAKGETERPWCSRIPSDVPTLPEVLGLYGYDTALFRSRVFGGDALDTHFDDSFAVVSVAGGVRTPWPTLQDSLVDWWGAHADGPRLAVVVVSDLMYTERPDIFDDLGLEGWTGANAEGRGRCAGLHQQAVARYDADAAAVGQALEGLLQQLDGLPSERPQVTVVGSTNGMSLGEIEGRLSTPDFFFSNSLVLDRTTHVPLVVSVDDPDGRLGLGDLPPAVRVTAIVELVDLLPTLLELGGAVPPAGIAGRSLLGGPEPEPYAYAELGDMVSLRSGRFTVNFRAPRHNSSALDPRLNQLLLAPGRRGRIYLNDVVADPMQLNVARPGLDYPVAQRDQLYEQLCTVRTGLAAPPPEAMTPERVKAIRLTHSEGYW